MKEIAIKSEVKTTKSIKDAEAKAVSLKFLLNESQKVNELKMKEINTMKEIAIKSEVK
eukprot:CAMPEP_0194283788 /NCGR_PEP_ID=MMETSP0169-20130528/26149_1 /TAXON_ID=218684 /ORGANISM="Corethron pennatum, Strain L29A3" /LENGTH=57 /DNA_ID=CAMNT_0039029463 /DNA_START=1 /DNA_END=171 /DNA_ORIENTATION=-